MIARTALFVVLVAGSILPAFSAPTGSAHAYAVSSALEARSLDARRFDVGGLLSALKGIFRGVPRKRDGEIDFDNLDLGDFTQDDADELERQLEAMMASAGSTPETRALDARRFDIGGLLSALKGIFRGVPRKREENDLHNVNLSSLTDEELDNIQQQIEEAFTTGLKGARSLEERRFDVGGLLTALKSILRGVPRKREDIDLDDLDLDHMTQAQISELERQLEAAMAISGNTARALDARRFDIGGLLSALKGIFRGVPRRREEDGLDGLDFGSFTQDDADELEHQLAKMMGDNVTRSLDARRFDIGGLLSAFKSIFRGVPRSEDGGFDNIAQEDADELERQLKTLLALNGNKARLLDARRFDIGGLLSALKGILRGVPRKRSQIDLTNIHIGTTVLPTDSLNELD